MKKLSLLLLVCAAHTAQASHHFNGFYAGAAGGGIWLDANINQTLVVGDPANFLVTLPSEIHIEGGGALGYVDVGYVYQFKNHITLGLEAVAGFTNASVTHRSEAILATQGFTLSGKAEVKQHNDLALLFKPGYVIKGHTHLYALVGPRWANFDNNLTTTLNANNSTISSKDSDSAYQLGITAGVGLEHMLTNNLSLGLEYAYTSYGSIVSPQTDTAFSLGTPVTMTDDTDIEASTNTIVARLSYHF